MSERTLPGLGLTGFWDLGQDDWNTANDTNLRLLSVLVGGRVKSRTTALPETGSTGDIYIIPSDATSNANEVAVWDGVSGSEDWVYLTPQLGWTFFVEDASKNWQYTAADTWSEFAGGSGTVDVVSNVAADRILGRTSTGSGDSEELAASDVRTLLNVEDGATADQTDVEIETAYNSQVTQVSTAERTAGAETGVRRFSPADIASMASTHGGGSGGTGAVNSVNGATGTVVLDPDDLSDTSTTNKFTTAADISKLAGIEASATTDQTDAEIETAYNNQVNQVSTTERTAGTETAVRRFSPADIASMAAAHGGSGSGSASGEVVLLEEDLSVTSGSSWTITDLQGAEELFIQIYNLNQPSGTLVLQVSTDGGTTWLTATSDYRAFSLSPFDSIDDTSQIGFILCFGGLGDNQFNQTVVRHIKGDRQVAFQGTAMDASGSEYFAYYNGWTAANQDVNAVRIVQTSTPATLTTGKIVVSGRTFGAGSVTVPTGTNAKVSRSTTQSLTGSATTSVVFDTEEFDNGDLVDLATDNDRITCTSAGVVQVMTAVGVTNVSTDTDTLAISVSRYNSSDVKQEDQDLLSLFSEPAFNNVRFTLTAMFEVAVGDYFKLDVFHGQSETLEAGECKLSLVYLST